mmetsp:Transcript_88843/g.250677  ORF Transcript_88843/g.250677 Transcript_88843/m.250677 type:complete len:104 (-) Transcript_88843:918-1229(-)
MKPAKAAGVSSGPLLAPVLMGPNDTEPPKTEDGLACKDVGTEGEPEAFIGDRGSDGEPKAFAAAAPGEGGPAPGIIESKPVPTTTPATVPPGLPVIEAMNELP